MTNNKIVLVTGCAGFIGSHLCDTLITQSREVVGLDNFITGYHKNITKLMQYKNFTFIEGDIRDYKLLKDIIKNYNITHISHQAARSSVPKSVEDPLLTNEININGTLNLLQLAKEYRLKKFVCAISSSIYGNTETLPKVETMPYHPESPYAITKVAKEMYCKTFYELYGLPTIGLRYFNVYGPRQDPQGEYAAVIPRWIQSSMNNEDLPLNGEGKQARDFTYISDVVDINIQALESTNLQALGKGYNVAFGERTLIKSLGKTIIHCIGSQSKLISAPARIGDIQDSLADISLAKNLLQFSPQVSIQEGIQKTIAWYKDNSTYFIL